MNRFASTLAVLLTLGSVAACGPTQPAASPTQEPMPVVEAPTEAPMATATIEMAPAAGESYTDPAGYTVTLPASWTGKVTPQVVTGADVTVLSPNTKGMTQFMYQPIDATLKPEPILTLSTFAAADWEALMAEGGAPVGVAVGTFGEGMVLVATTPQSSPYAQGTADQMAFDTLYQDLDTATLMTTGATSMTDSEAPEVALAATPEPGSAIEPVVMLQPLPEGTTAEVGTEVGVPVMAADPDGVGKVELQINGVTVASTDWPQAEKFFEGAVNWTPKEPGTYEVVAIATDPEGHVSELSRRSIVVAPKPVANSAPAATKPAAPKPAPTAVPDMSPPSVSIEPKSAKIKPGEKMSIYTNAVGNSGIVKLELHVDDKIRAVWTFDGAPGDAPKSAFQTLTWPNTKEGQHTVFVKAFTATGGMGQSVKEKVSAKP